MSYGIAVFVAELDQSTAQMHHQLRAQEKVDKYRAGYAAQDMRHAFLPAFVSTSGPFTGNSFACCISLPTARLSFASRLWMRLSMSTLRLTAGGGAGFSGACGLPLAWRVLRPLPCALKFSAKPALGHEPGAHMLEQHYPTPDFGLSLHRMELSIFCCISSFFLLVRAALKLRSLHLPPLRLCRIAVFSIKSTPLSAAHMLTGRGRGVSERV